MLQPDIATVLSGAFAAGITSVAAGCLCQPLRLHIAGFALMFYKDTPAQIIQHVHFRIGRQLLHRISCQTVVIKYRRILIGITGPCFISRILFRPDQILFHQSVANLPLYNVMLLIKCTHKIHGIAPGKHFQHSGNSIDLSGCVFHFRFHRNSFCGFRHRLHRQCFCRWFFSAAAAQNHQCCAKNEYSFFHICTCFLVTWRTVSRRGQIRHHTHRRKHIG